MDTIENDLYALFAQDESALAPVQVVQPEIPQPQEVEQPVEQSVELAAGRLAVSSSDLYDVFSDSNHATIEPKAAEASGHDAIIIPLPIRRLVEEEPVIQSSPLIVSRVQDAVELALAVEGKVFFKLDDLIGMTALHGELSGKDQWEFKQACKANAAFDYLDHGQFGVSERLTPENYWPGTLQVEKSVMDDLVKSTLRIMEESGLSRFSASGITGIVKSQGLYLLPDDHHELFALLSSCGDLIPMENGSYILQNAPEKPIEQVFAERKKGVDLYSKAELKAIGHAFHGQRQKAFSTINGKAKKRIHQALTRFPRVLHPAKVGEPAAKHISKLKFDLPRQKGRGFPLHGGLNGGKRRRQGGRGQGKKITFEKVVAEANKQPATGS